jgi:spermidine synthase
MKKLHLAHILALQSDEMTVPKWKIWLSYFFDQHLETLSSGYNESLRVCVSKGRLQLLTPNAIYSFADKYDNFTNTFAAMDLDWPDRSSVLVLGLGLASIPYMLEKTFNKHYEYTCVEIDPCVIKLASKYVLPDLKSDMQIIQADAQAFIYLTSETYDIICIDVFIDDKIPESFRDPDFLHDLDELLNPGGLIIFNHLAMSKKDVSLAQRYYDDIWMPHYPDGTSITIKGNRMMISQAKYITKK